MLVIYKSVLIINRDGINWLELRKGSKILSVHNQHNQICVWYQTDLDVSESVYYRFYTIPTGENIKYRKKLTFLGTVLLNKGNLVYHIFYDIFKEDKGKRK